MHEPNTICVCSATKGALVNDFPCLHWSTAEGGAGGKVGEEDMEKTSQKKKAKIKVHKLGSIPVLSFPLAGFGTTLVFIFEDLNLFPIIGLM